MGYTAANVNVVNKQEHFLRFTAAVQNMFQNYQRPGGAIN